MLSVYLFFKQQTAYEVRISDWSSDVCSADLRPSGRAGTALARTDAATRRSRRGGVRAGGDRDRGARGIAVGTVRPGAGCLPRAGCGGVGDDRRLTVPAPPPETDVDDGPQPARPARRTTHEAGKREYRTGEPGGA